MISVSADFRIADVMEIVVMNGYSRIPAYGENLDDIVGVVHVKDILIADHEDIAGKTAGELRRPMPSESEASPRSA